MANGPAVDDGLERRQSALFGTDGGGHGDGGNGGGGDSIRPNTSPRGSVEESEVMVEATSRAWVFQIKSGTQEDPGDVDLVVAVMNRELDRFICLLQDRLESSNMAANQLPSQWLQDVHMLESSGTNTALMVAMEHGFVGVANLLIEGAAAAAAAAADNVIHESTTSNDRSPNEKAAAISEFVNFMNWQGQTALMVATLNGNVRGVAKLLASGAEINASNASGETPLLLAARLGSVIVQQLLIGHGANVAAKDAEGRTAHQRAVLLEWRDSAAFLKQMETQSTRRWAMLRAFVTKDLARAEELQFGDIIFSLRNRRGQCV